MICKDCIHYKACKDMYYPMSTYDEEAKSFDESNSCDGCPFYSEKSRYIELPCKVGDTAYELLNNKFYTFIHETKIDGIAIQEDGLWTNTFAQDGLRMWYKLDDVGKEIFLTREEAEKALKEREVR